MHIQCIIDGLLNLNMDDKNKRQLIVTAETLCGTENKVLPLHNTLICFLLLFFTLAGCCFDILVVVPLFFSVIIVNLSNFLAP